MLTQGFKKSLAFLVPKRSYSLVFTAVVRIDSDYAIFLASDYAQQPTTPPVA